VRSSRWGAAAALAVGMAALPVPPFRAESLPIQAEAEVLESLRALGVTVQQGGVCDLQHGGESALSG
jgi:hypothetical protein